MVGSTLAYTIGELQFYIYIKFMLEWYHVPALSVLGSIGKKTGKVKEKERGEGKGGKKEKAFTAF